MKSMEQEIAEMENFYNNCSLAEAFTFFKQKSAEVRNKSMLTVEEARTAVTKIKSALAYTDSFFRNQKPTVSGLYANTTIDLVMQNRMMKSNKGKLTGLQIKRSS